MILRFWTPSVLYKKGGFLCQDFATAAAAVAANKPLAAGSLPPVLFSTGGFCWGIINLSHSFYLFNKLTIFCYTIIYGKFISSII